jgi:Cellulose biosynthesis GIL
MTLASSAQLGIAGLPPRMQQLSRGMIYAVVADQQSIRIPLLARTLIKTIEQGAPTILLSQAEPSAWLKKARLAGIELASHVRSGALKIFRHQPDSAKQVFKAGASNVISELSQQNIEPGSLVVIDQADAFFLLADPRFAVEACQAYQDWAEEFDLTIVAAFVPSAHAPRDFVTLRAVSENMAGFALSRNGPELAQLEFRHWFGPSGPNPRTLFGLRFDDHGLLVAHAIGRGPATSFDSVLEIEIATRRANEDFTASSTHWKTVENYADALAAIKDIPAGTLLLHFSYAAEFRTLCQTVAAVRAMGRAQWRVIVRERGAKLRIPHTVALLRLGASMIIPETTDATQGRLVAEAFRGTLFTRAVEARVDTVIEDLQGLNSKNVREPAEFRRLAEQLMAAGSEFEIPHTLVRLGLDQIDGERISSILSRRGARDMLFAEHDQSLWVFLFGCAPEQAEAVLARLLGRNFERLFQGWFRVGKNREILSALAQMQTSSESSRESIAEVRMPAKVLPLKKKTAA